MSRLREALGSLPDSVFVDVLESDDAYAFVVDVPGATADTVDVRVEGRTLAVDARREKDVPADFDYRSEERSLFLELELPLPPDATESGASASVEDGVLDVRLPKGAGESHSVPVEG
ncbi:Hsp20/alpha crystallin family protein [Halobacterium sp. CBA1126]|uniref:Hsp20/alpha crystallin family protein n=1 Tax=Halobacterium TaxID=2239 RepID=UPI0012FB785C|nr:Hsp20/alpha crystallin family protein [Halobacterium sp. CBA1126]MUV61527.1 Hsp20 family protein [Halobacterium sp. CBA1126]